MSVATIEHRLLTELTRAEDLGESDRVIPVIISLDDPTPDSSDLAGLEGLVRTAQRDLRERLSELGINGPLEQMTLANAVSVVLTPNQIRHVADFPGVRSMILNREDSVIT